MNGGADVPGHISRKVNEERCYQATLHPGPRDYSHNEADWVSILARELGLMAPADVAVSHRPDPALWERGLVRIMAVSTAALEVLYGRHPELLEHKWAPKEGDEGRAK
jgi:hypothetical protein